MINLCSGKVKVSKKFREEQLKAFGVCDDKCYAYAKYICEGCGKPFCHNHLSSDKHKCNDSVYLY